MYIGRNISFTEKPLVYMKRKWYYLITGHKYDLFVPKSELIYSI